MSWNGYFRGRLGEDEEDENDGAFFSKEEQNRALYINSVATCMQFKVSDKWLELHEVLDLLPQNTSWIAGGALTMAYLDRFEEAGDIDVFFQDKASFDLARSNLVSAGYQITDSDMLMKYVENPESVRHLTYEKPGKKPIQLIKMMWFRNQYSLLETFDLTICQLAIGKRSSIAGDKVEFYAGIDTINDIEKRLLIPQRTLYPFSLIHRIKKYMDRGFSPLDTEPMDNPLIPQVQEVSKTEEKVSEPNPFDDPEWKKRYYGI